MRIEEIAGEAAQPAANGKPGVPAKPGQGVDFTTTTVGINAKDLNDLATQIAERVAARAL